jgi:hypothetical protein
MEIKNVSNCFLNIKSGVQRFSFGCFWSPTLQLWVFLESKASALGVFGVQSFSFGCFWSPKLQLWVFLESNASALGVFGVQRFSFGIVLDSKTT